jgi:hypothetical protein
MPLDSSTGTSLARPAACVVCDRPCDGGNLLCSRDCLLRANREIDQNVAVLHRRSGDPEARAALAARNGYLTSALLRWQP